MSFSIGLIAALIDRFVPVPEDIWGRVGHPVTWMGRLIDELESRLNGPDLSPAERRRNGSIMLQTLVVLSLLAAVLLHKLIGYLPLAWLIEAAVASVFLAHRDLSRAVERVAVALSESPDAARTAVSRIVGRDTKELDEHEISRAAIESLAENSSDGVIAPLFWFCLLGLPGIVVYKAINTADSMVGHRSERFADFGRASAIVDDWVNWIPARLTGLLYVAGSLLAPRGDPVNAFEAMRRDAPKHASPNAGWPEAAMAGALNIGLGGPRAYEGVTLDLPKMGDGRRDLDVTDIRFALALYRRMTTWALVLVLVLALLFG